MTLLDTQGSRRVDARKEGTYDIYIEIDIDCEELVDACGLEYKTVPDDKTQNEVAFHLDRAEYTDVLDQSLLSMTNEQTIATALLNHELGECCTRVELLTPAGDTIIFK